MKMPRIMPLVAIAAGGVLAINAVENGPGLIGAARAFAEGASAKHSTAKAASAVAADASATAPADSSVIAAKPAPICAESPAQLAKDAGLSPAELQVIQSLGARRGELDQREQGLSTQLALIQAAEAKVDARIATMNQLKADMQGMLGALDNKQQAEVDRLVKVYEAMKPADSAARFVLLTDEVRLPIAAKMKERVLSAMIAKMPPPEAKRLTESLAARYVAQAAAARQAMNPQPQAAAAPPAKPATPQLAQATTTPDPSTTATDASATPAKPAAKPAPKPAAHHKPKPAAPVQAAAKSATPYALGPGKPVTTPGAPKAAATASAAPKTQTAAPAASPKPAVAAASLPAPKPAAAAATPTPAKPPTPSAAASAPAKSG